MKLLFPVSSLRYKTYSGAPVDIQEIFIEFSFKGFTVKLAGVTGPVNDAEGIHCAETALSPSLCILL